MWWEANICRCNRQKENHHQLPNFVKYYVNDDKDCLMITPDSSQRWYIMVWYIINPQMTLISFHPHNSWHSWYTFEHTFFLEPTLGMNEVPKIFIGAYKLTVGLFSEVLYAEKKCYNNNIDLYSAFFSRSSKALYRV